MVRRMSERNTSGFESQTLTHLLGMDMVRCGTVWYGAVRSGVARLGLVWIWYGTVGSGEVRCGTAR